MSNILFLTSQYTGTANANGICTRNIVNVLKNRGHNVFVLCYEDDVKETNVFMISNTGTKKDFIWYKKLLARIKGFFGMLNDESTKTLFINATLSICKTKNIDAIVYVYFPLETVTVLAEVKEQFPKVINIVYELDSVGDGIFASTLRNKLAVKLYEHFYKRNYQFADSIIIMSSHKEYWDKAFGGKYGDKLLIADIPMLTQKTVPQSSIETAESISFVYGGVLGKKYRSPEYFLNLIDEFSKSNIAHLDLYTKGDCEHLIKSYTERNKCFHSHGFVTEAEFEEALNKSNFLVSIGNRISRSVPSKLISYISYGKPVIHFSSQKNDICVPYLEQYSLGVVLFEYDSIEHNLKKLSDFISRVKGKTVCFRDLQNTLIINTPEYSGKLILDSMTNNKKEPFNE